MTPLQVRERIKAFRRRFGEAHYWFACHAAFPLGLTAELLYFIWASFQLDEDGKAIGIPWIAVSDLLLSEFCQPVGPESFAMSPEFQAAYVDDLTNEKRFGVPRLQHLNVFISAYYREALANPVDNHHAFAKAQELSARWVTVARLEPGKVISEIQTLAKSDNNHHPTQRAILEIVYPRVEASLAGHTEGLDDLWETVRSGGKPSSASQGPQASDEAPPQKNTLLDLANEYEALRKTMSSSSARTKKLKLIYEKMKNASSGCRSILPEFRDSKSAGQHLVAIAILHVEPDPTQLDWLALCLDSEVEKPFVGYQAATALFEAAVKLPDDFAAPLARTLQNALDLASRNPDDRQPINMLNRAIRYLNKRTGRGERSSRADLLRLAAEYNDVRARMPSSASRTREMNNIFNQMVRRCSGEVNLLESFLDAGSAGQRLVAIAVLNQSPAPSQLEWLARRLDPDVEAPFVGFQAAVALLQAARSLDDQYLDTLAQSLRMARALADRNQNDPPRIRALNQAQAELERRLADRLRKKDASGTDRQRDLAASHEESGNVQRAQGNLAAALVTYRAALAIRVGLAKADPANTAWQRDLSVSYENIGDTQSAQGDAPAAVISYQASLDIRQRLAKTYPTNTEWQRDLYVSNIKIGDVQAAHGDAPAALISYQASLAIVERLITTDPDNAGLQRDLAVSHIRIGDVQRGQGDLSAAIKSYQASLAFRERLVTTDPDNLGLRRDLAVCYNRIGDAQRSQDDLMAALKNYLAALTIREQLISSEPNNAELLRDVFVSHNRIGGAQRDQGDLPAALYSFQTALSISERLAETDPGNTRWQRDIAVSHTRIGDVQHDQGDLPAAIKSYQASLTIMERLMSTNSSNAESLRDVAMSLDRIGGVQQDQSDAAAALDSFQAALSISEHLAETDPGNTRWQRDVAFSHTRIGDVQREQGNMPAALDSYWFALGIIERLAKSDPTTTEWQRGLSVSLEKIGDVQHAQGDLSAALTSYQSNLAIAERLSKTDPSNTQWQRDVARGLGKIARIEAQQGFRPEALALFRRGREMIAQLQQKSRENAFPEDLAWFDSHIADLERPPTPA
jgi:tetratricopeptide (TPR) repeat protein